MLPEGMFPIATSREPNDLTTPGCSFNLEDSSALSVALGTCGHKSYLALTSLLPSKSSWYSEWNIYIDKTKEICLLNCMPQPHSLSFPSSACMDSI